MQTEFGVKIDRIEYNAESMIVKIIMCSVNNDYMHIYDSFYIGDDFGNVCKSLENNRVTHTIFSNKNNNSMLYYNIVPNLGVISTRITTMITYINFNTQIYGSIIITDYLLRKLLEFITHNNSGIIDFNKSVEK